MRTLDGYLSRKAQVGIADPTALIYVEEDGTYTLERESGAPLSLGDSVGAAQQAIHALRTARQAGE